MKIQPRSSYTGNWTVVGAKDVLHQIRQAHSTVSNTTKQRRASTRFYMIQLDRQIKSDLLAKRSSTALPRIQLTVKNERDELMR